MPGERWDEMLEQTRRGAPPAMDTANGPVAPVAEESLLPGPGDPYRAAGAPDPQPLTRLCCIMGRDGFQRGAQAYRYFQYVHLDSDTSLGFTDQGQVITLRFAGSKTVEVTIYGRNLLRICDGIHQHRIPWVRMADRDFRGGGEPGNAPIITGISVEEVG
jgi:hypothetical protein